MFADSSTFANRWLVIRERLDPIIRRSIWIRDPYRQIRDKIVSFLRDRAPSLFPRASIHIRSSFVDRANRLLSSFAQIAHVSQLHAPLHGGRLCAFYYNAAASYGARLLSQTANVTSSRAGRSTAITQWRLISEAWRIFKDTFKHSPSPQKAKKVNNIISFYARINVGVKKINSNIIKYSRETAHFENIYLMFKIDYIEISSIITQTNLSRRFRIERFTKKRGIKSRAKSTLALSKLTIVRANSFHGSSFDDVSSSLMTPSPECDTCHGIVRIIAERDETITEKSDKNVKDVR